MTELEAYCLERIRRGYLRLTADGEVEHYSERKKQFYVKRPSQNGRGRYRYQFKAHGRTILRHKLTWMIVHRQAVPDDCVVDHVDTCKTNDHPSNLELMTKTDSNKQGSACSLRGNLARLCRWFDFVGQYGREPASLAEQSWAEWGF